MRKNNTLHRMIVAAMLMAIGMVLPKLLGGVQVVGQTISPLHVIALIAGLTLGGFWGGVVGAACPLLGHFLFSAPPVIAIALPMAFECLAYGVISGVLYPLMRRMMAGKPKLLPLLTAQFSAMFLGRLVGGAAKALLLAAGAIQGNAAFTFAVFISSYFVSTAAGAVLHIIIVPAVVVALEKARLSPMGRSLNG